MKVLTTTVARILFAIPILFFGINHFMNADMMSSMIPAWMPAKLFLNYVAGGGLVLAAVAIITQISARLACLLLAVELLIFVLTMHIPTMMDGDPMGMISALKDTALIGGCLVFAGVFGED